MIEDRPVENEVPKSIKREGWQILYLDEAPIKIIDGDRGSNYPQSNDFESNGYCLFLNARNVTNKGFDFSECSFISKEKDEELRKGKLNRGDVVLTTRGTVGNVAIFDGSVKFENIRINSGMVILRTNNSKLLSKFLYYSVKSQYFKNQIRAFITGSAQPQLPIKDLRKIKIYLPNLLEQQLIADFFGILDKKIELNNQMNKTLEDIAQAIFKRWFIDFEFPNENGEPYKTSGGEMVESELGMIPRKFKIGFLSEIAAVKSGRRPSEKNATKTEVFKYPLVGASSINGYVKEPLFYEPVIVIGRVGTHGVVQRFSSHSFPSDNTQVIISKFKEFSFQILKRINYAELNVGSTQPLITQTSISNIKIIIPPEQILTDFEDITKNLYKLTDLNNNLNESISKIRDLLLPKLMTGKIRVPLEEQNVQ